MVGSAPAGLRQLSGVRELVGRDAEHLAIKAVFDAPDDVGAIVLLTGEPGIGKSSVMQVAIDLANDAGWRVRHAAADELGSGRVHALLRELFPELRDALSRGAVSGIPSTIEFAISPRLDTADTLAAHVEELRTGGPVLLAVDDLQWADGESLYALGALVRRARPLGIVIVAARRPDPTSRELALFIDVAREAQVIELVLEPLDDGAVERLAHELLEGPISPDLRSHLDSAGGNPWLITELVDHAHSDRLVEPPSTRDATSSVPPAVQDAVRRRLRAVDDDVATLLRVAAVVGKTFSVDEVALVASEPIGRVAIAMAMGAEAGFLAEAGDLLTFRHDLFRQALEAELPRAVARALHRTAATALLELGSSKARVAPHLVLGARTGDTEAFGWLVQAAEEAAQLAPGAAADLLAHAANLCRDDDPRRTRVEQFRARLLTWGGHPQAAEQLAGRLLVDERDPNIIGELQSVRARALFLLGRPSQAVEVIERSAADAAGLELEANAMAMAELALVLLFGSDLRAARGAAMRALEHDVPEPTATSLAHSVLGWIEAMSGRAAIARAHVDDAVLAASEPEAFRYVPHLFAAIVLYGVGDPPGARLALRTGRTIGTRLDVGWDRAMFDWAEATMAFLSGEWSDAIALGEAGEVASRESGLQLGALWHVAIGALVALRRGERDAAQAFLDRADGLVRGGGVQLGFDWWAWAHAVAARDAGQPGVASDLLSGALRVAGQSGAPSVVNLFGLDLVKAALESGSRDAAEDGATALSSLAATSGLPLHRGLADHAAGLLANDASVIERGIVDLEAARRPYELGRALADAALVHAGAGDGDAARAHARRALAVFDELGATVDGGRLREALRTLGVVIRGSSVVTHASTGWESLTRSERTIVELVAQGLSNAEIAERLFVSRRTVESHLVHVYPKLGARSRVELARLVADQVTVPIRPA